MFVSLRIAEIGKHTIAHVFGDKAAIALDQLTATAVIGADDSRKSSRSSLADSSVEPTRSQNMSVSRRRSADATVFLCGVLAVLKFTSAMGVGTNLAIALRMRSRWPALAALPYGVRSARRKAPSCGLENERWCIRDPRAQPDSLTSL